jgi:hypothetical protein
VFVSYNEFFGSDEVRKQRNADVGANMKLDLFPKSRVGVDTYADFLRIVQPSNDGDTENAFNRDSLRVGAGITWRPGGGLFSWRAGYELGYNYFEDTNFRLYDNFQHTVSLKGRWRFLPRTSFLYEGQYTWVQYAASKSEANGNLMRSRIGVNGLVTNHFGFLGMVGWGASFYDANGPIPAQQFDSITGQAEVRWYITPQQSTDATGVMGLSSVALGYTRDFANSYLGDFYQRDRGYLDFSYMLGGLAVIDLQGGVSNLAFPATSFPGGSGQRNPAFSEQRVDAQLFGEYRFSDEWGVNTTIRYDQNFSDTLLNLVPNAAKNEKDDLRFARWQAFLGVRWFM